MSSSFSSVDIVLIGHSAFYTNRTYKYVGCADTGVCMYVYVSIP